MQKCLVLEVLSEEGSTGHWKCLLLGDCAEATSLQKVTELIATGQENMKTDVEIADNITLLISKGAMKYWILVKI